MGQTKRNNGKEGSSKGSNTEEGFSEITEEGIAEITKEGNTEEESKDRKSPERKEANTCCIHQEVQTIERFVRYHRQERSIPTGNHQGIVGIFEEEQLTRSR